MKEIITDTMFRKKIESNLSGGYLFFGDEDYLKLHALKFVREKVCADPSIAVFNDMVIDCSANDFSTNKILSALSVAPMMSDHKIVTLSGLCVNDLKASEIDDLCVVCESLEEYDFNTFIISVPSQMIDTGYLPKRPSATLSKLCKNLTPVWFEKVPESKLASWAVRHFANYNVKVESGVSKALFERCGKNMFALSNEIEKLCFYILSKGKNIVTIADVEHITCENEEFDNFALSTAITEEKPENALKVISNMKAKKIDPVIILGELSRTFSDMISVKHLMIKGKNVEEISKILKVHEYKIKLLIKSVKDISLDKLHTIMNSCIKSDLALKLSPNGYLEIEKLICSL